MPNPLAHRTTLAAALVGAALLATPAAARAHAILMDSTPPAGGSVPAGKIAMTFRYNSRIDAHRSRLTLVRPDRSQAVLPATANPADDTLETGATLVPGAYVLRWQVLALDGHITRGDVPFSVTGK